MGELPPHSNKLKTPTLQVPEGFHEERPYIVVNMAASVDGKISTASKESFLLGSKHDWRRMDELRAQADAILNGAGTIRSDNPPVRVRDKALRQRRLDAGKPATPWNVLASNSGVIDIGARIFREPDSHIVLLVPESAGSELARLSLPDNVRLRIHGRDTLDLNASLQWLKDEGVGILLAEGGGTLNGGLLRLGAVDEVFLTIAPTLLGGSGAPTSFDGAGLSRDQMLHLELVSCEPCEDEVFLHYRRQSRSLALE